MIDPEPVQRPGLHTNGDLEPWAEQYLFLAYTLRMTPMQIAQIDHGFDPDHPDAESVAFYAYQIARDYPLIDARASIMGARDGPES